MRKEEIINMLDNSIDVTIDFMTQNCADHRFVEALGYEVKEAGDCSCYCPNLRGISFSSWGDWGSIYVSNLDEVSKDICKQMFEKDIIRFFRLR